MTTTIVRACALASASGHNQLERAGGCLKHVKNGGTCPLPETQKDEEERGGILAYGSCRITNTQVYHGTRTHSVPNIRPPITVLLVTDRRLDRPARP